LAHQEIQPLVGFLQAEPVWLQWARLFQPQIEAVEALVHRRMQQIPDLGRCVGTGLGQHLNPSFHHFRLQRRTAFPLPFQHQPISPWATAKLGRSCATASQANWRIPFLYSVLNVEDLNVPLPPEYNFEVVAGKVLDQEGSVARFAFVCDGGSAGESAASLAMRPSGVNKSASVTVLTDGAAGLHATQRCVAPEAEHLLDWLHVGMRFENLKQVAKGINGFPDGAVHNHALSEIERAKWRFWNGYAQRGVIGLVHLARIIRETPFPRCFGRRGWGGKVLSAVL
jgi:hypothetical protein